ncbi:TorF family putative porin [Hydrogenophaga sp. OTU3427]|uniref:TorF family putative porin n=1 Tax=Hydrogenophaga sp. OTU3427 TaxID=3043856 RepID=UPI00313A8CF1
MNISAIKSLAVVALAASPLLAAAQLSANVSLNTSYKFRGQDQTANKPALQGGFDYAFANGLYVGNWNSNVTLPTGSLEMDLYGGYKGEVSGIGYDVGVLHYAYPGASSFKTTEVYGGLSYAGFSAKYSHTVSSQYFGSGSKAGYLSLGYSTEISKGLTLSAAVGLTDFKQKALTDFTDYSVGLGYDLGDGYSVKAAFVGANKKAVYGDINKNRLVLTVAKAM